MARFPSVLCGMILALTQLYSFFSRRAQLFVFEHRYHSRFHSSMLASRNGNDADLRIRVPYVGCSGQLLSKAEPTGYRQAFA